MASGRRVLPQQELDIRQIIKEAQVRWLRPLEVCEILRNYQKYNFRLNPVPPNLPPSGSLFLFDRKALRYFRKDGHQWRKKKDGKTVREAHERLKAGSIDVLHCYYAHGEQDPNFQRRSYWMLEGAYEHIVLVHYLEISQGHRPAAYRPPEQSQPLPVAGVQTNYFSPAPSEAMSPENVETASGYQDEADSSDDVEEVQPPVAETSGPEPSLLHQLSFTKDWSSILSSVGGGTPAEAQTNLDDDIDLAELLDDPDKILGSKPLSPAISLDVSGWNGLLQDWKASAVQTSSRNALAGVVSPVKPDEFFQPVTEASPKGIEGAFSPTGLGRKPHSVLEAQLRAATEENALKSAQQYGASRRWPETPGKSAWQPGVDVGRASQQMGTQQSSQFWNQPSPDRIWSRVSEQSDANRTAAHFESLIQEDAAGLKKMDSFGRWVMQEMVVDDPGDLVGSRSESGSYWATPLEDESTTAESSSQLPMDVSVTISDVQRFTITDFCPDFAVANEETKVLITGRFLEAPHDALERRWCCMFGDVEVPAEVINDGVLRCKAPPHAPGRIPFYITCSDRLACSEVREFEIRSRLEAKKATEAKARSEREALLQVRLAQLLLVPDDSDGSVELGNCLEDCKLLEDAIRQHTLSQLEVKERLLELFFRQKLQAWLSCRRGDPARASIRDDHGQGVLHMVAALGYDWAVRMAIEAGVLPDFRDRRGWTALHWAASFGREETVLELLALGASPGPLTDSTSRHPSGQMPSELAAASGHKGIAGFLAEKALTGMLSSLTMAEKNELSSMSAALAGENAVIQDYNDRKTDDRLSLQRSLSAVRNATKAAALIHSAYRQDSFRKRNTLAETEPDEYGMGSEDIQALVMHQRSSKMQSAAALQIQRKFRGWKGRKDFLNLRKHVVRIQAHVRGHQARKQFRKILWVVGVVEKAVLRWRRKRVGLRGFRIEESGGGNVVLSDEDNDDFLRQARKQKEQVLEKAVTRVQSMARSDEGRAQYRRMLEGERAQYRRMLEGERAAGNRVDAGGDEMMYETQ